mmetsp:Transcript_31728/g.53310  ORF Transcript_31728/g.53310 Transcript_31728/m.53310 type:complete len:130 (+) Transcript_31728:288-677(+)|eukprot:CAMPEP_0198205902 /NCGR_PEP_ID=MMETSP1445-20131203/9444_1 /TAXON_ID=36898 /ORGANISM="Pyramimonas sp., Strain CCMP2087" /LENGTH=129 /DNA_ID=CAMNT_0043878389 /DNA_START=243 /DNA_END=632 /DNA_ORIENTATION=+
MSWKHGHGNRSNLKTRNYDPESGGLMQQHRNEALDGEIEGLRGKIKMLKKVSNDIGDEVNIRGRLINDLEHSMTVAQVALKKSLRFANKLYQSSSSNHMIYLTLFVFAAFLVVYFFTKANRLIGFVSGS